MRFLCYKEPQKLRNVLYLSHQEQDIWAKMLFAFIHWFLVTGLWSEDMTSHRIERLNMVCNWLGWGFVWSIFTLLKRQHGWWQKYGCHFYTMDILPSIMLKSLDLSTLLHRYACVCIWVYFYIYFVPCVIASYPRWHWLHGRVTTPAKVDIPPQIRYSCIFYRNHRWTISVNRALPNKDIEITGLWTIWTINNLRCI